MAAQEPLHGVARYPLLDALCDRRSRRFGVGMRMDAGPFAFWSRQPGLRLTEGSRRSD